LLKKGYFTTTTTTILSGPEGKCFSLCVINITLCWRHRHVY